MENNIFTPEEAWQVVGMLDRYIKEVPTTPENRKVEKEIAFKAIQKLLPICNPEPPEAKEVIVSDYQRFQRFL